MLAASLNAFFCASPIYGSAEDFTSLLNFTPCKSVTPAAKQQIGETRKKRLAKRPAFFRFDNSSGIIKGEQPLIRASRASKVAGAFLVLFWHAKENLALPQEQLNPRHQRENLLKKRPCCNRALPRAQAREAVHPPHYSSHRYPYPHTVRIWAGWLGSSSTFIRRRRMLTSTIFTSPK